jgi:hypothetical protein
MRWNRPQPSSDTSSCRCSAVCRIDTVTQRAAAVVDGVVQQFGEGMLRHARHVRPQVEEGAKSRAQGRSSCRPASG